MLRRLNFYPYEYSMSQTHYYVLKVGLMAVASYLIVLKILNKNNGLGLVWGNKQLNLF